MIIKMVSRTRTKVIECDSYHIEKLDNKTHRWQIMKDATQGDTNGCILDQVMEHWSESENLKVFVTENGKTVDTYSYYSKPDIVQQSEGELLPMIDVLNGLIGRYPTLESGFLEVASTLDLLIGKDEYHISVSSDNGKMYPAPSNVVTPK